MLYLAIFILASWGLTQILVSSRLLNRVRPDYYFFHCPMCVGFWVGALLYSLYHNVGLEYFDLYSGVFIMGCVSSATSYALCQLFSDEGINFKKN